MADFTIDTSRNNIDMELYRMSSLPASDLMRGIKNGIVLSGWADGRSVAVCVMERRGEVFEILHWAVLPEYQKVGYGKELMLYALDYIHVMDGRHVQTGAPNSDIQMFVLLQKLGFRVIGVYKDYYIEDGGATTIAANSIETRDMLRYSIDLKELLENIKDRT